MTDRNPYECPTWPQCSHECLRDGQVIVQSDRLEALRTVADAARSVMENHDAQRYLHRPDWDLFIERGGFPRAEELRMQEGERKSVLRVALAALDAVGSTR